MGNGGDFRRSRLRTRQGAREREWRLSEIQKRAGARMNTALHEANSIFRERGVETRKGIPRSQRGESGKSIELRRGECRVVGGGR